jgi:phosphoglycolate phosphatase
VISPSVSSSSSSRLVVFDLDGTLVDSQRDLADSTNEMLAEFGAPPLPIDSVASMVGDGARALVERAIAASGLPPHPDALAAFRRIYDRRLLEHTRPYPGVEGLVRMLADRTPLAVLTNKPEAPTRRLLDALGLAPSFRWVVGGDSGFARKPDPSGLLHLIQAAGASPATTLVIGDSMVDVETARAAGARVCAALYGFGHLRAGLTLTAGEWTVDDARDLDVVVEQFLSSLQ